MPQSPDLPNLTQYLPVKGEAYSHAQTLHAQDLRQSYALQIPLIKADLPVDYIGLMGMVVPVDHSPLKIVGTYQAQDAATRRVVIGDHSRTLTFQRGRTPEPSTIILPAGIRQLRDGNSVVGISHEGNIDLFIHPLPPIAPIDQNRLRSRYDGIRAAIDGGSKIVMAKAGREYLSSLQKVDRPKDALQKGTLSEEIRARRFGAFDERLLIPELMEFNVTTLADDTTLSFVDLQAMYPTRVRALNEGYVTMGTVDLVNVPKRLAEVENVKPMQSSGDTYRLPALGSLYQAERMLQAGFSLILGEAEVPPGHDNADMPAPASYVVMVKREAVNA